MATNEASTLVVSSPAFQQGEMIPSKYTCEGSNINPPLQIDHIPEETKTLALITEDPDAPKGTFDHWLVWNIPPKAAIGENTSPGISGANGAGKTGYHGPCPPSGSHRYYFHVYALDTSLDLLAGETKEALQAAMETHILASGSLMGRYQKQNQPVEK
jgi:Raf kinase inhibitor-like YbhB/YbcL family protein